jgi:hypothetical protein
MTSLLAPASNLIWICCVYRTVLAHGLNKAFTALQPTLRCLTQSKPPRKMSAEISDRAASILRESRSQAQ